MHPFPIVKSVAQYNTSKLHNINRPAATIKAVHSGPNVSKASSEHAGGLDPIVLLHSTYCIMLTANLWVDVGLINDALGTVASICYREGYPPALPLAVMAKF